MHLRNNQQLPNAGRIIGPLLGLRREPFATGCRQLVPLSLAARFVVPRAAHQAIILQTVQQRIQSAGWQIDSRAAGLAHVLLNQIAIVLTASEHREDHQVQAAAEQIALKSV